MARYYINTFDRSRKRLFSNDMVFAIWRVILRGDSYVAFMTKIYDPMNVFKKGEELKLQPSGLIVEDEYALIKELWSDKYGV
jgi:hypothetical protein